MIIKLSTDEVMEKPMKTLAWEINERKREIKYRVVTSTFLEQRAKFFILSLSGEVRPTLSQGVLSDRIIFPPPVKSLCKLLTSDDKI